MNKIDNPDFKTALSEKLKAHPLPPGGTILEMVDPDPDRVNDIINLVLEGVRPNLTSPAFNRLTDLLLG